MAPRRTPTQSGAAPRRGKVPGFGWKPNLTGLEHPRQWLGFLLTVVAVIVVSMLIAVVAFG